jgi:hypothetical protein
LTIYFNADYGPSPVTADYFTAAAVFAGSLVRPVGGALADRIGGIRALSIMYVAAATALVIASFHLPQAWMALLLFIAGMTPAFVAGCVRGSVQCGSRAGYAHTRHEAEGRAKRRSNQDANSERRPSQRLGGTFLNSAKLLKLDGKQWLGFLDTYRTLYIDPTAEIRVVFDQIRHSPSGDITALPVPN